MRKSTKILIIVALILLVLAFTIITSLVIPKYVGEENIFRAMAKILFEN